MNEQLNVLPPHRYFIIYKPAPMLSQFTPLNEAPTLRDLNFTFPEGIHAIGRLDNLSEGLLILTTNKKITRLLFQDSKPHVRNYLVKVNYQVTPERLQQLKEGVAIKIKGGLYYKTTPCDVSIAQKPAYILEEETDFRHFLPHTWLRISLTEGKFHQVRKMVAAIHHRCQRLIRISIEDLSLEPLKPGEVKEIEEAHFFKLLKIEKE